MTTDYRALCAELTYCWSRTTNPDDFAENAAPIIGRMKAALAHPEPVGPSDRIISIAMAAQKCAFAWEPTARLIGNVCAEDIADLCGAVLAIKPVPTTRKDD